MRLPLPEAAAAAWRSHRADRAAERRLIRRGLVSLRAFARWPRLVLLAMSLALLGVVLVEVRWAWTGSALIAAGLALAVLGLAAGEAEAQR